MKPDTSPLDKIELTGLVVDCIVGVYPAERLIPQPLHLDLELHLDTRAAARGGALSATVDYARLAGELRFLLESCRFLLLETAAEALCRYILAPATADAPHALIEAVELRLTKPQARAGGAVPSLTIRRERAEFTLEVEDKAFGKVDVVHVTKGCGVYRLRVAPQQSIPIHVHRIMDERELVLGDKLHLQGRPVRSGTAIHWPHHLPHRYDNPSDTEQTILCVDRPSFIADDEVPAAEPDGGLVMPSTQHYWSAD